MITYEMALKLRDAGYGYLGHYHEADVPEEGIDPEKAVARLRLSINGKKS